MSRFFSIFLVLPLSISLAHKTFSPMPDQSSPTPVTFTEIEVANPVSAPALSHGYLALGDSYTIGESVPIYENFPYQLVQLLRGRGMPFQAPEILAKTGWTTDELQEGINRTKFLPSYDLVTLLVGVNNQYRGRTTENYAPEFESLLKQAIRFAGGKKDHVVVLSIPDWGATPYAEGRDPGKIGREIDAYNAVNKRIALQYGVYYVDITPGTREAVQDKSLVARDGLHPSGKDYARWAMAVAERIAGIQF
jgi:lysophospholipase L1-like esterase